MSGIVKTEVGINREIHSEMDLDFKFYKHRLLRSRAGNHSNKLD